MILSARKSEDKIRLTAFPKPFLLHSFKGKEETQISRINTNFCEMLSGTGKREVGKKFDSVYNRWEKDEGIEAGE
jgi:hypothetical protein